MFSLLEHRGYVCFPPVSWYNACGEGGLVDDGQDGSNFVCKFLQHSGGDFVLAAGFVGLQQQLLHSLRRDVDDVELCTVDLLHRALDSELVSGVGFPFTEDRLEL